MPITQDDFDKDLVFVKLEPLIRYLNEVTIMQYPNINAVALGIISPLTKHFTPAERRLNAANNPYLTGNTDGTTGGSLSIDPLLNWISGRTTMLEKQVEIEKKETLRQKMEYLFEDSYFISQLKIPKEYVDGFKYYIIEESKFVTAINLKNKISAKFIMSELAVKYLDLIQEN